MKKHILLLFFLIPFFGLFAQNISVKSFRALPMDMTASSLEGKKMDQNGEVAALIKVMTTETGFVFEGGTLGIVDTQQRVGEIWVWVPRGLRKITILHQQLGGLRDYRFPVEIESEHTYEMVLTTAKIETVVKEEVREQYLMFQINPPDAVLEVNDQMWPVSAEGTSRKLVDFGSYSYRVQAPNYHSEAGKVTVDDPDNTHKVVVTLRPNFGWIEVPGEGMLKGASVYVDNALVGKAPCKSGALKSGQHNVRIIRDLYEPYTTMVTVSDNETTKVKPDLTADFAHVTLKVDGNAEIWVNDEKKGTRTWTGDLASGTYKMECRLENHEPTSVKKEITNKMNGEVIQLEAPKPIYGSMNVESSPDMAKLFIDGKDLGETPKLIKEILVGQHEIKLTKEGYNVYSERVTVTKGQRKQVNATLVKQSALTSQTAQTTSPKPKPSNTKSSAKKTYKTNYCPIRYANLLSFAYSTGSFGSGFNFSGNIGGAEKLVGWYVGYDVRGFPNGGYHDGILSLELGGGAGIRLLGKDDDMEGMIWFVGLNGGYSCFDYSGASVVLDTKLEFIYTSVESALLAIGVYLEGFVGTFGSTKGSGVSIGLSWSFLNRSWDMY